LKLLVILFSVVTFVMAVSDSINSTGASSNASSEDKIILFTEPKRSSPNPILVEEKWKAIAKKRNQPDKSKKNENSGKGNSFSIGGENYRFSGVFTEKNTIFVLLQPLNSKMMRLEIGDVLKESFVLTKINHNSIVFESDDEQVEYKLFELKNNVKN